MSWLECIFLYATCSKTNTQRKRVFWGFFCRTAAPVPNHLIVPLWLGFCRESKPVNVSSPSSPTHFSGSRRCAPTSSSAQRSACLCFRWWSGIPATESELWENTQIHLSPRPALGYVPRNTHADVEAWLMCYQVNQSFSYYGTECRGASLQRYFSHENASRGEQKQKGGVTQERGEENQTGNVVLWFCTAADDHVTPVWWTWALSAECAEAIV